MIRRVYAIRATGRAALPRGRAGRRRRLVNSADFLCECARVRWLEREQVPPSKVE
jgi:hypothetical protein